MKLLGVTTNISELVLHEYKVHIVKNEIFTERVTSSSHKSGFFTSAIPNETGTISFSLKTVNPHGNRGELNNKKKSHAPKIVSARKCSMQILAMKKKAVGCIRYIKVQKRRVKSTEEGLIH